MKRSKLNPPPRRKHSPVPGADPGWAAHHQLVAASEDGEFVAGPDSAGHRYIELGSAQKNHRRSESKLRKTSKDKGNIKKKGGG